MSCDSICISLTCWNSTLPLTITIKTTSAANHAFVFSLLEQGYSVRDIERKTGLGKSTVGRIKKKVDTGKENSLGGCPSKLSAHDKTSIFHNSSNSIREAGYCCSGYPFHQFYSSTPCPPHNSQKGTSGEWFLVCYKEESAHVEEDSSSEAAGVCTTTWKLVTSGKYSKNLAGLLCLILLIKWVSPFKFIHERT